MQCKMCWGTEFETIKRPDSLAKRFPDDVFIRRCIRCGHISGGSIKEEIETIEECVREKGGGDEDED